MLIGRDAELAKLGALFKAARTVTLHGPPGIGKTALARAFLSHESDALLCDLTSAKTYEDVCFVLAGKLDVSLGGGKNLGHMIGGALDHRESVTIVLDGAECAPDAIARLVVELEGERRKGLHRVLVTSRELLHMEGEVGDARSGRWPTTTAWRCSSRRRSVPAPAFESWPHAMASGRSSTC